MKIATITCNNADNYGARLQAFALQHYLQTLGHEVVVIDYCPEYVRFKTKLWYMPGADLKGWVRLIAHFSLRKLALKKHAVMEQFSEHYLKLTRRYASINELRSDPPVADAYITGSDQIWNTSLANGKDPAFYLDFGPGSVKRISYAASFALPSIPESLHGFVADGLRRFDLITVREPSAVRIVESLGECASLVCDPVFLLSADFWSGFADRSGEGDDYVLVYDFERNATLREVAEHIASNRRLKIFSVSPRPLVYADRNYCTCKPETFVALFKNARYVVSNSLHGTIFSLIFRREFFVVNRADGLNVRMADLLNLLGINDRIVTSDSISKAIASPLDYIEVYKCLDRLIDSSKSLLNSIT